MQIIALEDLTRMSAEDWREQAAHFRRAKRIALGIASVAVLLALTGVGTDAAIVTAFGAILACSMLVFSVVLDGEIEHAEWELAKREAGR
jgi:uncharacterized membrane protein YbaN (DUF454 family)